MAFFEKTVSVDTVEIDTTPEIIWEFWVNMDKNYLDWHPEAHIAFQWIKGNPMEEGAQMYAEENVEGTIVKGKGSIVDVVKNRKFTMKPCFPRSLFCTYEYLISQRKNKTVFSAYTHLRYPRCFRGKILAFLELGKKHVREEGENLKKLLEAKQENSGTMAL